MNRYLLLGAGTEHLRRIQYMGRQDFSGELVTLDMDADLQPDVVHDLNDLPYPFEDGEFDEIHAYECLEHCGTQGDGRFFFAQFGEFWRLLKPSGALALSVPQWDSEIALGVPDHKRVFPPCVFQFLEPRYYERVGQPGVADYRKWLGCTHFEILGIEPHKEAMQLYVLMRAVK